MLNAKVGSSTNSNPSMAGVEALKICKENLNDIKMLFVYSSVAYDQKELLSSIKSELPNVPIIGNTSFTGVITPEGYISGDDGFVGIMAMEDDDLKVGIASSSKNENARETGHKVALEAMKAAGKDCAPNYFYMVASPGEEESYLKGISEVIGRVPFFGGSAADNSISGEWKLFSDENVISDGVAVAFFYSDKAYANEFSGKYNETSKVGIITKVDGKRGLVEIDGVPALEKYAQWTGVAPSDLLGGNILGASITAPLGVKDRLGDLVAIRHPMFANEDYSINVGNDLAVGTAIILMEASVEELIDSTTDVLEDVTKKLGGAVGAYHIVHCGGRRAGMDERIAEVYSNLKKVAGNIPFIAEFTFGEYGYEDDGNNTCGGLMLSFSAFSK